MTKEASKTFQDLVVWQRSHKWVLKIYALTKKFPKEELYGITSQLRRAAVSVTANIAEGFKRKNYGDKARFYNIAQSSLEECRYYLILSKDLNLAMCDELINEVDEISRILEKYYNRVFELASQK